MTCSLHTEFKTKDLRQTFSLDNTWIERTFQSAEGLSEVHPVIVLNYGTSFFIYDVIGNDIRSCRRFYCVSLLLLPDEPRPSLILKHANLGLDFIIIKSFRCRILRFIIGRNSCGDDFLGFIELGDAEFEKLATAISWARHSICTFLRTARPCCPDIEVNIEGPPTAVNSNCLGTKRPRLLLTRLIERRPVQLLSRVLRKVVSRAELVNLAGQL